ncbi:CD209 antigen-like protein C isoform X2 [Cavia porcellus]|uniref:CD209 antigen-like protein C isoform X2 n=1 Tax=Cavia porcellus TaxID=10141 RepID=UPI002FE20D54
MAVPETAQAQKPGYLDEEQLISSRPSYAISGSGYRLASVLNSLAVFSIPSRQEYEQDQLQRKQFYKEIAQMKDTINNLCRPCSWDWTFFQGKCYFFSKSQKSWHDSITACKEEGAELVIVESAEEQSFLQQTSKSKGIMWMGLSDLNKEGTWHWVDGSPLSGSFADYWNKGEPNNVGGEDCAEFKDDGWNDSRCENANFWICKKTAKSCSQN